MKSLPFETQIPLGFAPGKVASFTITATELKNIQDNMRVILHDAIEYTECDMTNGSTYSFTSNAIAIENRFSLILRSAESTTSICSNVSTMNLIIYTNNEKKTMYKYQSANNKRCQHICI